MNERELKVYDQYPSLITALVTWASQVTKMPVDDMLTAVQRMRLTSAFIGPKGSQKVDPTTLADHEELLELIIRFRNDYLLLAMRSQRST